MIVNSHKERIKKLHDILGTGYNVVHYTNNGFYYPDRATVKHEGNTEELIIEIDDFDCEYILELKCDLFKTNFANPKIIGL